MGLLRAAVKIGGLLVLAAGVVIGGGLTLGVFGVPSAGIVDRGDWGTVTNESIAIETTYFVDNPNPGGLSSDGATVEYTLAMNDVPVADGTKTGIAVPSGRTEGTVTTTVDQDQLPAWWRSHVSNGERSQVDVGLNASVPLGPTQVDPPVPTVSRNVSTNITGAMEASTDQYRGGYPEVAPIVEVRDSEVTWGEVTDEETPLRVTFLVHNPNPTVIPVPAFAGNLTMNEVHMARWNASELQVTEAPDDGTIGPGETERITYQADIQNEHLDEWLTSHASRGERSNVTMTAALAVSFQGETYTIPRSGGMRCDATLKTDIFVDNQTSDVIQEGCSPAEPETVETARTGAESFAQALLPSGNESDGGLLTDGGNESDDGGLLDESDDGLLNESTPTAEISFGDSASDSENETVTPTPTESDSATETETATEADGGLLDGAT